jgi:hypothetical protein
VSRLSRQVPLGGILFLLAAIACLPGRAGSLAPEQVLEITYDHTLCFDQVCEQVVTTIHRRGGAHRSFYTDERHDSTRLSGIDSTSFEEAVSQLAEWGVLRQLQSAPPQVGWPSLENWVITVTTASGSRAAYYAAPSREVPAFGMRRVRMIEEFLARLRWHVPVG